MTGASTTISTSSAQSRENARQPATSAWLSNVPYSWPVMTSTTVYRAGAAGSPRCSAERAQEW